MSSSPSKFPSVIHVRDFMDSIMPDHTQPESPNYVEILADVNIIEEEHFQTLSVIAESISTCIHAYLPPPQRDLFITNAFFYAIGRFATSSTSDGHLQLTIEILSLERYLILSFLYSILLSSDFNLYYSRHSGDVSNFNQYQTSLPNK